MSTETSHNPRFYDLTSASCTLATMRRGESEIKVSPSYKRYIYTCVLASLSRC
jgi:hypothetical protein